MSSDTWTPAALRSELRLWRGRAWRLVEAQHRVATMKLVDTTDEQQVLEDILEDTKPPVPPDCAQLDYLLFSPFRYGPYPHGSRFRRPGFTPGVWYGSERPETAVAEIVFYRFLFFAESPETPWPEGPAEYTGFAAAIETRALDLTAPPLHRDRDRWMHPTEYHACQKLAEAVRAAGAGALRYASVRDPGGRVNLAVLICAAFAQPRPVARATWRIRIGAFGAFAVRDMPDRRLDFPRDAFSDRRLNGMTWDRAPR